MKIKYFIKLLLILFLNIKSVINSQENNNNNNNIIDIYFNSSNGNDTIGDGTINKPYQSLCKLNQILTQGILPTNSSITLYFGYGEYNSPNCTNIYFIDYNNISIKSYNASNNSSSINNKSNIYIGLNIKNSNLKFKGQDFNLNINSTSINSSKIIFEEKVNVIFQNFAESNIEFSNVTIRGESIFGSLNGYESNGILASDSLILVTEGSTLYNITFFFRESNVTLIINEKSNIIDCFFSTFANVGEIIIKNSIFQDSNILSSGTTTISGTTIKQTKPNDFLFFEDSKSIFELRVGGGILNIEDSKIIVSPNILPNPILYSHPSGIIKLKNVDIRGYVFATPIFRLDSNVSIDADFVQFKDCISSSVALMSNQSSLFMSNSSFIGCTFDSMVEISGSRINLVLSDTFISCDDGNSFSSMITMPTSNGPFLEKSTIFLVDMYMECVGEFDFQNATVTFVNVTLLSTFKNALISLYSSSEMNVDNSIFLSNSYNPYGTLFSVNDGTLTIVGCTFTHCSTTILKASESSMIYIEGTYVISLKLTGQSAFIIINSTLSISSAWFHLNQITDPLINSLLSEINLYDSTISYFGSTLLNSQYSNINIGYLNLTEAFTQDCLFKSLNDIISIQDSVFENNHGFSSLLFQIYQGKLTVTTTTFLGNSFGPMFETYNSSLTFGFIEYKNNSGSFLQSTNDQSLVVYSFQYINNKVPYDYLFFIENTLNVSLGSIEIINNYINQYYLQAINIQYMEIFDFTFEDNVDFSISITPPLSQYGPVDAFLNFIDCQSLKFERWYFTNNHISANLISFYGSNDVITIENFWFLNNKIQNTQYIIQLESVNNITFNNCQMLNNNGGNFTTSLIKSSDSNITIINSEMSNNNFKFSGWGSILNYNVLSYESDKNYFQILNSNFSNNTAQYGGVFSFSSFINTSFDNPQSKFEKNIISFNYASRQAGAIYTDTFPFSFDME